MVFRRIAAALILVGAAVLGTAAVAAEGAGEGEAFIESLADKAVAALTVPEISRKERVQRFRDLLKEHFAVETIGRWVLGRHWRQATPEQQDEYLRLFENLIVSTYVDRFDDYSGETLTVTGSDSSADGDLIVHSRITRPAGGEPVNVSWHLRKRDGQFKIVDVMVAGISMGLTQRSEFSSVIRQSGGKIEGLLAKLRKEVGSDA